jgi:hypothetical protein
MQTIFISGKITGDENYKKKFWDMKRELQKRFEEWCVISPTDIDLANMEYEECLDITKKIIEHCDMISMLKDWEDSHGAIIEHNYAMKLHKNIVYQLEEERENYV